MNSEFACQQWQRKFGIQLSVKEQSRWQDGYLAAAEELREQCASLERAHHQSTMEVLQLRRQLAEQQRLLEGLREFANRIFGSEAGGI